jgi:hypothetical protein
MPEITDDLRYRVVGIRANESRDVRFENLSFLTAEMVMDAMKLSRFYSRLLIEDQDSGAIMAEHARTQTGK